jgi:hypothetical protein
MVFFGINWYPSDKRTRKKRSLKKETTMNTIIITEAMAQAYAEKAAAELSELLGTKETPNLEAAYKGLKEVCMFAIEKAISRPAKSQERYLPNGEEA